VLTPVWSRLVLAVGLLLVLPAGAAATTEQPLITSQAKAANARFLAYAPPPPTGAGALCLVDSGVDLNPDTQPNVIERHAVDGGDPGDVHPTKHGTRMAMVAGGQTNSWGGVGVWPHLKVVSVRALPSGARDFSFDDYRRALNGVCLNSAARQIKLAAFALGNADQPAPGATDFANDVQEARAAGVNVVAAVGNSGGSADFPASSASVLGVGAGDFDGALCPFSARGPGLDIVAPGCRLEVARADGTPAWGDGTSEAAIFAAAVIVALRSYSPALNPIEAEQLVLDTAVVLRAGKALDVENAFRAAGLHHIVEAGNRAADAAAAQGLPETAQERDRIHLESAPGAGGGTPRSRDLRLPKPRVKILARSRAKAILFFTNRPRGAVVDIRLGRRTAPSEFAPGRRLIRRRSSRLTVRLPRTWSAIDVTYVRRGVRSKELLIKKRPETPTSRWKRRRGQR
jgi:Subtilase family